MGEPKRGRDRRPDIETLAANIFARLALEARRGKTADHLATEALASARAFYRLLDESSGSSAPDAQR